MNLIAHRGGSVGKENSLETMIKSAKLGADAVECDIRKTKDGVYVIYHDENLHRLSGNSYRVSDITFSEMKKLLLQNNEKVITFDELVQGYKEKTPILLHVKLEENNEEFASYVANSGLPLIVGVVSLDMLKCFNKLLPAEKILAFLPKMEDAEEFYKNGAGIIRLWEHWLEKITPDAVKSKCENATVYIMACDLEWGSNESITLERMDGSIDSLNKCYLLKADGVLLNKIEMALDWRNQVEQKLIHL